jgi:hypothetical protein
MENVTTSPEQPKNNQAPNETAKSQQPKKTWIEPELVSMGDVVEGGGTASHPETDIYTHS